MTIDFTYEVGLKAQTRENGYLAGVHVFPRQPTEWSGVICGVA